MKIGVVSHASRGDITNDLVSTVNADVVNIDTGYLGCATNHIVVLDQLRHLTKDPDGWVIVLEDDAVPIPNFRHHAGSALNEAPGGIISFYLGTGNHPQIQGQIEEAVEKAEAWITADFLISCVGYAIQAGEVSSLIRFIQNRTEEMPLRVTKWVQEHGITVGYTQPSLVDHADVQSVIAGGADPRTRPKRKAWRYGTREKWNTSSVELGRCDYWSA